MDLSVVIVNYRGWKYLNNCLEAFGSFQNMPFSYELIVIDNCSDDGQFDAFQTKFPGIYFMQNTGNNGFSNGCNLGASIAKGAYLLFMNPDIIASSQAIGDLLQTIRLNPQITILSCKQINLKGKEEQIFRFFPSFLTINGIARSFYRQLKQLNGAVNSSSDGLVYPEWVSGSMVLISKPNFEGIGRWSEDYWLYYEDVDLCRKAVSKGGKVALDTRISVMHNHGGTTRTNLKTAALTKAEVNISLHVYLSIHYSGLRSFLLHAMVIFNTLVIMLLPAIFGMIFFFINKPKLYRMIYLRMLGYYFKVLKSGSWLSEKSMKYKYE
jgi:GT2 family glycosyltransferase